jgi:probable F420-dependent oxidoreductase
MADRPLPEVGVNLVPVAAECLVEAAVLAEGLGYESVWLGEHVLTPAGDLSAHYPGLSLPFEPGSPFLAPLVALGHIATATTTIRLGTGVLVLPVRDVFLTARELTTVDVLSGGRLEVGVGLGWMREEYEMLGRDWGTRAGRMEEFITVLDGLWTGKPFEYHGEYIDVPLMQMGPSPVQSPRPRLHLGGHTPRALARCAALGDGWYGGSAAVPFADRIVRSLLAQRRASGLPTAGFQISVVVLHRPTVDELADLAAVGVHRVVVTPWRRSGGPAFPGDFDDLRPLEALADELGLDRRE